MTEQKDEVIETTDLFKSTSRTFMKVREWFIESSLLLSASLSILVTISILYVLFSESIPFFKQVSVIEFLTGKEWTPLFSNPKFGVLPLVMGTLLIVVTAGIIALPFGLGIGIYLSEYATPLQKKIIKPFLEILAGIPTIVYGYFALTFITPLLQWFNSEIPIFNALSAGIVVGIMILPMVASLSEDALRSVPESLRQGGYAMGATSYQVSLSVVVPAAISGISSAFILALSRAFGETMAVSIAAGAQPNFTLNVLEPIQTMTAYIVQVGKGDTEVGSAGYLSLFAVALLLFFITFGMNVIANRIRRKYREVYDS